MHDTPPPHDSPSHPPAWIPTSTRAVAGVCAAILAVGIGLLTAPMLSAPSPTDAVASEFIDRTPRWLREWAISWFGTADKTALRVGVFAVMALIAVLLGVVSSSRLWFAPAGFLAFGVFGVVCVLARPGATASDVVPTVLATVAGTGAAAVLLWLAHERRLRTHWPQRSQIGRAHV